MTNYKVFFISEKTKREYEDLKNGNDSDRQLYKYLTRAINDLSVNPFIGVRFQKNIIIPVKYKKIGVERILKYDLPKGWRMIYSIVNEDIEIYAVIIEWFDHKNYENRFNYVV